MIVRSFGATLTCVLISGMALTACGSDSKGAGGGSTTPDAGGDTSGSCTTKMYAKYGATAFGAVRDSIVTKALAAPTDKLGDAFQNFVSQSTPTKIDMFKTDLADFLVMVYGGPNDYMGVSMTEAHQGLSITSDQYDYFITQVVVPALSDNGVPESDITNCFAPPVTDAAFKASIVGK
jgi:hypothetical protein